MKRARPMTVLIGLALVGCPQPDIRPLDAGALDAGEPDAGALDAGALDAGADAGPPDAGRPDAGPLDAGALDAGPLDAGADAGPAEPNVVFVTSTVTSLGDISTRGEADTICNTLAGNGGLPGVGSYVAWLSTASEGAAERLRTSRGWVRPDGMPFVDTVDDLLRGALFYPPRTTEQGIDNTFTFVATGTLRDGAPGATCGDWASTSGDGTHGDPRDGAGLWSDDLDMSCAAASHLYCFGTGRVAVVRPAAPLGARAFVTRAGILGSAGTAAMDALCASEASAAGLPGTYRALVADDGAMLADRLGAGPWVRSDGVSVGTRAQVLAGDLDAPPNVTADGLDPVLGLLWWGTRAVDEAGDAATTCGGWSQAGGTGRTGAAGSSQLVQGTVGAVSNCTNAFRVACFQD